MAPSSLLSAWKGGKVNEKMYIDVYTNEVLNNLDPEFVVNELTKMANGYDVVLLCYEKSGDFCHRNLVADWIGQTYSECGYATMSYANPRSIKAVREVFDEGIHCVCLLRAEK